MGGYADFSNVGDPIKRKEASDIDIYIIVDSSCTAEQKAYFLSFPKIWNNNHSDLNYKVHFWPMSFNAEQLLTSLQNIGEDIKKGDSRYSRDAVNWLYYLALPCIGPKIEEYRKLFIEEINKWAPDEKEKLINEVISLINYKENTRKKVRETRIPTITPREHEEILGVRKEMWRRRLKKIWKIQ